MSGPKPLDVARLNEYLRALANPIRLQILDALREPMRAAEIRLRAAEERAGFSADRILSRPAIVQHLDILEEAKLVRRTERGFVVDQQTLFHVLEELGSLARIRPVVDVDVGETLASAAPEAAPRPPRPRLVVVGGPQDGRAVALRPSGAWTIGRGADCDLRLDHDPHASRRHATVRAVAGSLEVVAAAEAKNPVLVDGAPVAPGASARLLPGAVLTVGATQIVLQV